MTGSNEDMPPLEPDYNTAYERIARVEQTLGG
jgi:hypothetical protein